MPPQDNVCSIHDVHNATRCEAVGVMDEDVMDLEAQSPPRLGRGNIEAWGQTAGKAQWKNETNAAKTTTTRGARELKSNIWGEKKSPTYDVLTRGPTLCFFEGGGSTGVVALVGASEGALLLEVETVGDAVLSMSS